MPQVRLEREGLRLEAELSLNDIRELFGVKVVSNGNHAPIPAAVPAFRPVKEIRSAAATETITIPSPETAYANFMNAISDNGRKFLHILRQNPAGVEASQMMEHLGFTNVNQIGGLTGGGLVRLGRKFGVDAPDIYRSEITTSNGKRKVTYYPGEAVLNGKPA